MPSPIPSPIRDATGTHRGLMGIVDQTFAGIKTFLSPIKLALFSTGSLPSGEKGMLAVDDTTSRPMFYDGTSWLPVAIVTGGGGASLEAHIESPEAHPSGNITWGGGGSAWQDETPFQPNNLDEAILDNIVDLLAGPYGARKIGTNGGGGLTGLNIQEQLDELYGLKVNEEALAGESGGDMVGVAPYGDLHFTTVAGQLQELDDEKMGIDPLWDPNGGTFLLRGRAASGSPYSLSMATARQQIEALLSFINDTYNTVLSRVKYAPSSAKSWGKLTAGATPSLDNGYNVDSVTLDSANSIRVTFAEPMANADYHVSLDISASDSIPKILDKTYMGFVLAGYRPHTSNYTALNTGAVQISFAVFGNN